MTINIEFYGDTNVGKVRQNNEDNFLVVNFTTWKVSKATKTC